MPGAADRSRRQRLLAAAISSTVVAMEDLVNTRDRDQRDNRIMLAVTTVTALVIVIVLYFAGAFMRSTG